MHVRVLEEAQKQNFAVNSTIKEMASVQILRSTTVLCGSKRTQISLKVYLIVPNLHFSTNWTQQRCE